VQRQLGTVAGAGPRTSHKEQKAVLLSSGCKCQGQKQETKSRVIDIPTGPAGWCLFRLIQGGRRSVLEVTSIIMMVSIRSLTPSRQSLDTYKGQNSKVTEVSNDRISAS
jgi:hypothetical protein